VELLEVVRFVVDRDGVGVQVIGYGLDGVAGVLDLEEGRQVVQCDGPGGRW